MALTQTLIDAGRTFTVRLYRLLMVLWAMVSASERILRSCGHDQGDDHLLERPRNTGRDSRGRSSRRNLHRTRAVAWCRWQPLQGPGIQSAARHAVGVC